MAADKNMRSIQTRPAAGFIRKRGAFVRAFSQQSGAAMRSTASSIRLQKWRRQSAGEISRLFASVSITSAFSACSAGVRYR